MHGAVPWWWRPFWALTTIVVLSLWMTDDDYPMVLESFAVLSASCFGFEYFARQGEHPPPE